MIERVQFSDHVQGDLAAGATGWLKQDFAAYRDT
jgi:hypothetical protein